MTSHFHKSSSLFHKPEFERFQVLRLEPVVLFVRVAPLLPQMVRTLGHVVAVCAKVVKHQLVLVRQLVRVRALQHLVVGEQPCPKCVHGKGAQRNCVVVISRLVHRGPCKRKLCDIRRQNTDKERRNLTEGLQMADQKGQREMIDAELDVQNLQRGTVGHLYWELGKLMAVNKLAKHATIELSVPDVTFDGLSMQVFHIDSEGFFSDYTKVVDPRHQFHGVALETKPGKCGNVLRQRLYGSSNCKSVDTGVDKVISVLNQVQGWDAQVDVILNREHTFRVGERLLVFRDGLDSHVFTTVADLKVKYPLAIGSLDSPKFLQLFEVSDFSSLTFVCKLSWACVKSRFFADPFVDCKDQGDVTVCTNCVQPTVSLSTLSSCCRAHVVTTATKKCLQ